MKRIMIADDDRNVAAALSARLRSAGYETLAVHNGYSALQSAIEHRPDLVLMDIWMPGLGLAVAKRLRELSLPIPVILLTASDKEGLRAAALEVGAAAFIQKPYEPQHLLGVVARTLSFQSAEKVTQPPLHCASPKNYS